MNRRWIIAGAALAFSGLAACGGSSTPAVVQCTLPTGTQVALAYPQPGASGVPDSPGQIVVAASPALPNTWQLILQYPSGALVGGSLLNTISPSSVPTPFATPSFANPVYQASGLGGPIASGPMTINVLLNNQGSTCNGFPQVGTFTTQ